MNRMQAFLAERVLACGPDLTASVRVLSDAELWHRPAPAEWNIHQVVTHLVQTQRDRFAAITELGLRQPGAPITAFDAQAAMAAQYREDIPLTALLAEFRAACRKIARVVETARPADMRNVVIHPSRGPISVAWWAMHAYGHTHEHIAQIIANRDHVLRQQAAA